MIFVTASKSQVQEPVNSENALRSGSDWIAGNLGVGRQTKWRGLDVDFRRPERCRNDKRAYVRGSDVDSVLSVVSSLGREVGYAWKCDGPCASVGHISAKGVIRTGRGQVSREQCRLLSTDT